jgi:hypothetical protein
MVAERLTHRRSHFGGDDELIAVSAVAQPAPDNLLGGPPIEADQEL